MKHFLHKIALLACASIFSLLTFANGIEYKGIYYILDAENKTASVTYTGSSADENSYSGEITIPAKFTYEDVKYKVTAIGEKAFYGCTGISFINISGLIESIGEEAFANCGMESIVIPENVTKIAENTFKNSKIDIFMLGSFEDYSFLKNVDTSVSIFAPESLLQTITENWKGTAKSIEPAYYIENLSTLTVISFRLHKTEYYSLPNAPYFEFSSVITRGVEIKPDENGIYSWDDVTPGEVGEFIINYNVDYEDLAQTENISAALPVIECSESETTATSYSAIVIATEEDEYIPTEKGIFIDGVKYKADDSGKVEVNGLTNEREYTVKPYAVYKSRTYYGEEFTIIAQNTNSISDTQADNDIKITLNNKSREGYIEIAINCDEDVEYSIVNITGQKEKEGKIFGENKTNNISTDELVSGIYLLNVSGVKINKTVKFIIR